MNRIHPTQHPAGFTLVELLVALFLTLIITAGIYKGYVSYTTSNDAQEQIVELQQNLRIGMNLIAQDLRRVGMNNEDDKNAGFVAANSTLVHITMDLPPTPVSINGTEGNGIIGEVGEDITYKIDGNFLKRSDANQFSGDFQSIIANLEALDFVYLDEDAHALATPLSTDNMTKIRTMQVCMVVKTTKEDYRYTDRQSFVNLQGTEILTPQNDHFRRRLMSREIKLRNMGLK